MKPGFTILSHTADIMIKVNAPTLEEMYEQSVKALISIITDRRKIRASYDIKEVLEGRDGDDLLFNLLRWAFELLVVDSFLLKEIDITLERKGKRMAVQGRGEPLDYAKHLINREVKAVTLHQLRVGKGHKGYTAFYVLDV